MKKIFSIIAIAVFAVLALASCETYKIPETGHTNVAWLDGKYLAMATGTDEALFELEITNTTDDAADAAWITITDYNLDHAWDGIYYGVESAGGSAAASAYYANAYVGYFYFWPAYRFKVSCDAATKTFSCSNVIGNEPMTCYNSVLGGDGSGPQGYYTGSGYFDGYREFTISVSNGKLTENVKTAAGNLTDGISFDITITDNINDYTVSYSVDGIRKTGWAEDAEPYTNWLYAQLED